MLCVAGSPPVSIKELAVVTLLSPMDTSYPDWADAVSPIVVSLLVVSAVVLRLRFAAPLIVTADAFC